MSGIQGIKTVQGTAMPVTGGTAGFLHSLNHFGYITVLVVLIVISVIKWRGGGSFHLQSSLQVMWLAFWCGLV